VSIIDLDYPPPSYRCKASIDRDGTPGERGMRMAKDSAAFGLALLFAGAIYRRCFASITSPMASAEDGRRAIPIMSGRAGSLVGHLVHELPAAALG
jgi:hypothetical protein